MAKRNSGTGPNDGPCLHDAGRRQVKLLHIVPSYAPGGCRSRIRLLASGLGVEFSHREVALDGGARASPIEPGIGLILFAATPSAGIHPGNLWRMLRLLHAERPQILITYNWGSTEAALVNRLTGIAPHLHCEDGFSGPAADLPEPRRRALSAVTLSSLSEQLPFSLIEAVAGGLSVLATDVGDVKEALAPMNRDFVVRSGDEAGFAERLRLLSSSAELRRSLGSANTERARDVFDQQRMIDAYRSLLQRIAAYEPL